MVLDVLAVGAVDSGCSGGGSCGGSRLDMGKLSNSKVLYLVSSDKMAHHNAIHLLLLRYPLWLTAEPTVTYQSNLEGSAFWHRLHPSSPYLHSSFSESLHGAGAAAAILGLKSGVG